MRQALEDLIEAVETAINAGDWKVDGACDPTLALIRAKEALAQPEQEPVAFEAFNAWMHYNLPVGTVIGHSGWWADKIYSRFMKNTTPPQRTWVGLTPKQKVVLCKKFPDHLTFNAIEAIEAQLKQNNGYAEEKNT